MMVQKGKHTFFKIKFCKNNDYKVIIKIILIILQVINLIIITNSIILFLAAEQLFYNCKWKMAENHFFKYKNILNCH